MNSVTIFVLILAFCKHVCDGVPVRPNPVFHQKIPSFMRHLYNRCLAGKAPFSGIVHSNAAFAVNRSNFVFEATFSELGFLQHENLKRAQLRLTIPQQQNCNLPGLKVRVVDQTTGQIFGEYLMSPRHSGINQLLVTKSLRKFVAKLKPDTKLNVQITVRNPNLKNLCANVVSALSSEAYLVTNTDEVKTRKRRSTEDLSTTYRSVKASIFRRQKRSLPTCVMKNVRVSLASANNSIFILPHSFQTGVCGLHQPTPLSTDPMIQALAQAMTTAIQNQYSNTNSACCSPSKFEKLTVLYFDTMQHTVLRHVDNVKVTSCACSNTT